MNLNDTFHCISTIILTNAPSVGSQGTGFYYQRLAPKDKEGPQWRRVDGQWLVTNRHVLIPRNGDSELLPSSVTFHLRKFDANGALQWDAITLTTEDVERLARFHPNKSIDVATLNIQKLMTDRLKGGEKYANCYAVSCENFAGQNNIRVEASSDVLVVGYPRRFYDDVNLYPVIKAGIIASRWGTNFQGERYFLIDAKLFPGSSGSIVVSKPIDMIVKDGQIMHASEKQFAFLGVFSGEPFRHERPVELDDMIIVQKSSFNVGIVWYAELVDEILDSGVTLSAAMTA
jgi:hypothetical protein